MPIDRETLAQIEAARVAYLESLKPQRPGLDWFTAQEYGDSIGIDRRAATMRLEALRKAGMAEKRRVKRSMYYRVKP